MKVEDLYFENQEFITYIDNLFKEQMFTILDDDLFDQGILLSKWDFM